MEHELWPPAVRPNTIFVPETANDNSNNTEFLLDKKPCCLLSYTWAFRFVFFRELTHYSSPFDPLELEQLTLLSYQMSIISLHKTTLDHLSTVGHWTTREVTSVSAARRRD